VEGRESGHWVTSHPEHVVIDDVATPRRGTATPHRAAVHPTFPDSGNNAVFLSLAEVTHVLAIAILPAIAIQVLLVKCPIMPNSGQFTTHSSLSPVIVL